MDGQEKNRQLRFAVSERVASTLEFEAQLAGLTTPEFVRRAINNYVHIKSVQRDIDAHFEDGAELTYGITVGASDGAVTKTFSLQPNTEMPGFLIIKPLEEY